MDINPWQRRLWLYSGPIRLALEAAATFGAAVLASYLILRVHW